MAATKINLTKLVRTINDNAVRGRSYENLSYESFFTRKFPDLRYCYDVVFWNYNVSVLDTVLEGTLITV